MAVGWCWVRYLPLNALADLLLVGVLINLVRAFAGVRV